MAEQLGSCSAVRLLITILIGIVAMEVGLHDHRLSLADQIGLLSIHEHVDAVLEIRGRQVRGVRRVDPRIRKDVVRQDVILVARGTDGFALERIRDDLG